MAVVTNYREEFKTVSRAFGTPTKSRYNIKNRKKILVMPGKAYKPFIRGGIRWLVADDRTELTCELIENSKLIFLKDQTYAFDLRGKTIDGAFRIEYDADLLSRGHIVNPPNGATISIKKHRLIPLIMITGAIEEFIESRDVKSLFRISYEWDPDSSDLDE